MSRTKIEVLREEDRILRQALADIIAQYPTGNYPHVDVARRALAEADAVATSDTETRANYHPSEAGLFQVTGYYAPQGDPVFTFNDDGVWRWYQRWASGWRELAERPEKGESQVPGAPQNWWGVFDRERNQVSTGKQGGYWTPQPTGWNGR